MYPFPVTIFSEQPDLLTMAARENKLVQMRSMVIKYYGQIPYLRKLPAPVIGIIVVLVVVNLICWASGVSAEFSERELELIVLSPSRPLMGTAVLAYTLGLRHALDADHISAIDLMTRTLIASGQRPVTVGMYFSLGHSTIVIITSIAVAATAAALWSVRL
ncbi:high-affinity nickel-transport protein-domain-containing protein [Terfezia claveryi]|nr:high-affinity nickel-transport protein-domain-containing protein [Terfezia claveryi]